MAEGEPEIAIRIDRHSIRRRIHRLRSGKGHPHIAQLPRTGSIVKGQHRAPRGIDIVNGPTMDFVSELTEKQLTPTLIYRILQSPDSNDKLWALNRIDSATKLTPELETSLLKIIAADDFYLAYSAIRSIDAVHLSDTELQDHLFSMYLNVNHSIQKELVKKLMQAPMLSSKVLVVSRDVLSQLNGQQLDDLLKLYTKHDINDLETSKAVAKILENEKEIELS